jgi:hypothetical protein
MSSPVDSSSTPRFFSLEEANSLLPQVESHLKVLRELALEAGQVDQEKAIEQLFGQKADGSFSGRAQKASEQMNELLNEKTRAFKVELKKLNQLGAQLKDLRLGLIDFYASREEEKIFLCWQTGEDQIRFWHSLESGYAGRRPIQEL